MFTYHYFPFHYVKYIKLSWYHDIFYCKDLQQAYFFLKSVECDLQARTPQQNNTLFKSYFNTDFPKCCFYNYFTVALVIIVIFYYN